MALLIGAVFALGAALLTIAIGSQRRRRLALVGALLSLILAGWAGLHGAWQAWPLASLALFVTVVLVLDIAGAWRSHRPWVAGVCLVLLAGCIAPIWSFPIFRLPAPGGPYGVGTIAFDLPGEPEKGGGPRLHVRAWYPANPAAGSQPRKYFTPREARELAPSVARNFGEARPFIFNHFSLVATHSHESAPVALTRGMGGFPVILFNHGYWSYQAQNTALMERLASHGYVVFSLAHPGDSAVVRFEDGAVLSPTPVAAGHDADTTPEDRFIGSPTHAERIAAAPAYFAWLGPQRILRSLATWRADETTLLDSLERDLVPAPIKAILTQADLSRVGFVGMSFGGSVSASLCRSDARCLAAVNFDGTEFDETLFNTAIGKPMLMMSSDWVRFPPAEKTLTDPKFNANDYFYERADQAGLTPDVFRYRLEGLRHLGFTDLILASRGPARDRRYANVDGVAATNAINDLTLAFLDRYVKGASGAFPRATLDARRGVIRRGADDVRISTTQSVAD